jgi:protein TonB
MFEDATFESMGRIHTRSRNWMVATFGLNASFLAALIAIPLFHLSALPRMINAIPLEAPAPVEETKPVVQQEHAPASQTEMPAGVLQAPPMIPKDTWIPTAMEPPMPRDLTGLGGSGPLAASGSGCDPFNCGNARTVVHPAAQQIRRVSLGVMEGLLIYRVLPVYPTPAREMRVAGRVALQATIARDGSIENLRVASGPTLLQQTAMDAVKQWRYRPYLLNGEPVEVETTINVDFAMN